MALDFNATTQLILTTNGAPIDTLFSTGGSVSAWFTADTQGELNFGRLWNKQQQIAFDGTNQLSFEHPFSTTWINARWALTPPVGWMHFVLTYDGSNVANVPIVYYNATAQTIAASSAPVGTISSTAGIDLRIGNRTGTSRVWDGLIDDFRLYTRVLSAVEVSAIYESRGTDNIMDGLVSRWIMRDGAPATTAGNVLDTGTAHFDGAGAGSPPYVENTFLRRR